MENSNLVLHKAERKDAEDIAELNNSHLAVDRTQGFLITPIKAADFAIHIEKDPDSVYVAETRQGLLVGFLQLSESVGNDVIQKLDWCRPELKNIFEEHEALYIEKVVITDDYKRRKIGTLLYEFVFRQHPQCLFYSFVVRKPFTNTVSLGFHKKLGFVESAVFRAEHFLGFHDYESIMLIRTPD